MSVFQTFSHWSWSQLTTYRSCPFHARLQYLERLPQPPVKEDDPRNRGIRVHASSEDFINEGKPLCKELTPLEGLYADLITARDSGATVVAEKRIYLDANWRECPKGDHWLIVIEDINVTGPMNLTIDLKTGRKYGNEVKHFEQVGLYSVVNWCLEPNYDEYRAELWYADAKDVTQHVFTPEQLEKKRAALDIEVSKMMEDKIHRPRPNKMTCKYCPYSPRGTGACPVGV